MRPEHQQPTAADPITFRLRLLLSSLAVDHSIPERAFEDLWAEADNIDQLQESRGRT